MLLDRKTGQGKKEDGSSPTTKTLDVLQSLVLYGDGTVGVKILSKSHHRLGSVP